MSNTLCVDIGNYSVLTAVAGASISRQRSLIYDATHNKECRDGVHPADSPLIEVGGKHYKIGVLAKNYPNFLSAVEAGKSNPDLILPILLANTPDGFEGDIKFLVPVRDELTEALIKTAVVKHHEYSITSEGRRTNCVCNFTNIDFVRETDSAAKFAYNSGVIAPDSVALVADIGGGTVNAVICSYDNGILHTTWRQSYDNSGGIALAQSIANTDVVKSYGRAFDTAKIMDAITEGKAYIGKRTDLSFETVLDDCITQWFNGIVTRLMSAADKYCDEVTQVVWCGGGAEIVRQRLLKKAHSGLNITIIDNPQYANINGLIASVKPTLRVAA